ncbi:MAG: hypothetical protein AB9900_12730 [Humidesulfovibrio sp.]
MQYVECALTDLGFVDGEGLALSSIEGLDNTTHPFRHLGFTGYPDGALMCIDRADRAATLAILPDGAEMPEDGTELLAAEVVDLLLADYGWPEGTTLVDGLPVGPERAR